MPFPPPSRPEHRPLLLIVDDDAAVLEVTRSMARSMGCRALVADSAAQALEAFRERADDLHAVLVDLHMPSIDGLALIHLVRAHRPGARVVLMTGDDIDEPVLARAGIGPGGVLVKPFSLDDLRAAVFGGLEQDRAA